MSVTKNEAGRYEVVVPWHDGEHRFEFQKWGAEDQTDTLLDLMAVGGSALGSIASLVGAGSGLDTELTSSLFSGLMKQLTEGLTRDRAMTKRLVKKLSSDRVICDGVTVNWADRYKEDLALMFAAAKANLEVQYGNFFAAVAHLLPARSTAALSPPGGTSQT